MRRTFGGAALAATILLGLTGPTGAQSGAFDFLDRGTFDGGAERNGRDRGFIINLGGSQADNASIVSADFGFGNPLDSFGDFGSSPAIELGVWWVPTRAVQLNASTTIRPDSRLRFPAQIGGFDTQIETRARNFALNLGAQVFPLLFLMRDGPNLMVQPYISGQISVNFNDTTRSRIFSAQDGSFIGEIEEGSTTRLGGTVGAGLMFDVRRFVPGVVVNLGYRRVWAGQVRTGNTMQSETIRESLQLQPIQPAHGNLNSHEIMLGFQIAFGS